MGLLNGLMPGESYGIPDGTGGMPSSVNGMLNNPALQLGLGILANNQGNYGSFGAAIGKGGLMGLSNLQKQQEALRQQKLMELRDKQFNQEYGMKQAEFDQKKTQYDQQETAHNEFDTKFPQYKGLSRLNPQAAMKIAYPEAMAKAVDPYYTPIPLENGLARFNNRTGDMELVTLPNGQTVMKASDSPRLQGQIQGAKSQAQAQWKPNDMIPGTISTDAQVAGAARGGLPSYQGNMPYPPTWNGQPMGAPGTTATDMREGDANVNVGNPAIPQRSSLGLSVPTPAQLAAQKKAAEMQAEDATKTKLDLPSNIANAENTVKLVDELVGSRDGTIKPHKGFSSAVGLSSKIDPRNYLAGTDATDFNIRLDQLKGQQFMQAYQSLKGGGQITEVEGKKATDAISRMNKAASENEFTKAARDFQDVIQAGVNRAKSKAGGNIMPQNETMPQRTVVKRGKYGGKNVVQYSDGSVEYAN